MYGWIEEWTEAKYTAACTQINATLTEWDGYRVKFKVLSIFPMYLSNASLLAATVTRPETLKSCLAHVHLALGAVHLRTRAHEKYLLYFQIETLDTHSMETIGN